MRRPTSVLGVGRVGRPPHRRKNAKALGLDLEDSERLAKEKAVTATKTSCLVKEQARTTRRLARLPSSPESSDTSSNDDGPPDANEFDAYSRRSGYAKGKRPTRK